MHERPATGPACHLLQFPHLRDLDLPGQVIHLTAGKACFGLLAVRLLRPVHAMLLDLETGAGRVQRRIDDRIEQWPKQAGRACLCACQCVTDDLVQRFVGIDVQLPAQQMRRLPCEGIKRQARLDARAVGPKLQDIGAQDGEHLATQRTILVAGQRAFRDTQGMAVRIDQFFMNS